MKQVSSNSCLQNSNNYMLEYQQQVSSKCCCINSPSARQARNDLICQCIKHGTLSAVIVSSSPKLLKKQDASAYCGVWILV